MPQAIDLVVNNAASQEKTFSLISPAAGYGSVAEWALREGPISSVFPTLTAAVHGSRAMRTVNLKIRLPSSYTHQVTGLTNVGSFAELNVTAKLPADFPEELKEDFLAYSLNLLATPTIKSVIRHAAPAT